jgi:hypothetical protein
MIYKLAIDNEKQSLINSNYAYTDNRIDCLYIKRYYRIDIDNIKMLTLFNPTIFGLNTIKEGNNDNMSTLADKLNAKKSTIASGISNPINANNGSLQSKLLKGKLTSNKSALEKADLTSNKFAEVESLRQSIKTMQTDIINLQSEVVDFSKLALENNAFIAIISKDNKSILNAINALHGKFASNKVTFENDNQKVITRKASPGSANNGINSIASQNLNEDAYQGFYEHFKGYFLHKFAKDSRCIHLAIFKAFIDQIDFASLQSINNSCRISWSQYKTDNSNQMVFAPGSMELAITSLIQTGIDFDLIKDFSPIIDNKSKPEIIKAINDKFADSNSHSDNNEVKGIVKDFAYWANLLKVDISIIQECIASLKDKDNSTYPLIKEYISESSGNTAIDNDIECFIEYLDSADFAG